MTADAAKLRWRCRRGMRELDALLTGWLDRHHAIADDQSIRLFSELLDMQDPDIIKLINKDTTNGPTHQQSECRTDSASSKDRRYATIIEQIRSSVQT